VQYESVVFLQGDEAIEWLEKLDVFGEEAVVRELIAAYYNPNEDEYEVYSHPPHGARDFTFQHGKYILTYNLGLGYVGLVAELEQE
jgi:hypothetical protein